MIILDQLTVDENNIAFHSAMGNSYQLNDIGAQIINLFKQHKSKEEIIDILSDEYQISKEDLYIDVQDLISKLKLYGLM